MCWNSLFKKIIIGLVILQGVILGQSVVHVNVKGVNVPVVYEEDKNLPIASMQLVIGVSGSMEDGNIPGLAKFAAHLLGEGTKTLGAIGFAEALEAKAISLSAHPGTETFVFEVGALKEEFGYGVKMLASLIKEPNYTEEAMEKVRLMTLGMLSNKVSDFDYIANVALKELLFKDKPLGHPSLGNVKSIEAVTLKEVQDFLDARLDIANAIVVIGGDVSLDEAKAYAKEVLETLPVGAKRELGHFEPSNNKEEKIIVKSTEQAYIYFGSPFYMKSDDSEGYKAKVAAFILGESGFGSRLMEEIRVKRGLAYSAYGRISINRSYSQFSGYLQTKNESREEAVALVKEVVDLFCKKGVRQEELDQAKRFLLGSEPLRNETLSQRLSRAYFEFYRGFELGYSKKQLKQIDTLSLDELNAFIAKHGEIKDLSFAIVTDSDVTK